MHSKYLMSTEVACCFRFAKSFVLNQCLFVRGLPPTVKVRMKLILLDKLCSNSRSLYTQNEL